MGARAILPALLAVVGTAVAVALGSTTTAVPAGAGPPDDVTTTAIAVEAVGPPRWATAEDGRPRIEYDLVVTNVFVADVTLESLEVRAGRRTLLRLEGDALAPATQKLLDPEAGRVIPTSSTVHVIVDVVLPREARIPERLTNEIAYSLPDGTPANAIVGTLTWEGPRVSVEREDPIVIEPPLRGTGWWAGGGCCDPNQRHRNLLLAAKGRYVLPETFDIDWLRLVDDQYATGDGSQLTDYPSYGAKVRSVAGGVVTSVEQDLPEAPVGGERNPTLAGPVDYGGNQVVVKIASRRYAVYAHLQAGSVPVRRGQRVRAGEVVGLLGNTGNSTAPHLHFGIHDSANPAIAASVPFVIDRWRYQGTGTPGDEPAVLVAGTPSTERDAYPLNNSVADFTR